MFGRSVTEPTGAADNGRQQRRPSIGDSEHARQLTALEDATLAYAQAGDPEDARAFFTPLAQHVQVDPEETLRLLARAYGDIGDDDATEQICRELSSPC